MSGRTLFRSTWLPVVCWVVVIFGLSSMPDLNPPDVGLPQTDKIYHLGEYSVLGFLVARAAWPGAGAARAAASGAALGLLLGSLDEMYQQLTPGRQVSALDATADLAGAALGALGWRAWRLWTSRRSRP